MTDNLPRRLSTKTLVLLGILTFLAGCIVCCLSSKAFESFFEDGGDTPIIVRDGSIVIASKGADIEKYSRLGDNLIVHTHHGKALGAVKVNGNRQQPACASTQLCAYEFVWAYGKEGQEDYQEYKVYLWSGSPQSKGANIYSSVPIAEYTYAQQDSADPSLSTLTWKPVDRTITFRYASVITVPTGSNRPNPPSRLCGTANCRIEFEYR
jgi:hypothetical protein